MWVTKDAVNMYLYKVFGPHLGLLYVRQDLHKHLENQSLSHLPDLYDAYQDRPGAPNYLRIALNPGLVNHEAAAACVGVADYFNTLHVHHGEKSDVTFNVKVKHCFQLMSEHESCLSEQWMDWIRTQSKLSLIGPETSDPALRSPNWSFRVTGKTPQEIAQSLAEKDVAVQAGCFYAWRCLQALNINPDSGVLRISFAHFNSSDEVEILCHALDACL